MKNLFTDHPLDVGESYWQHLYKAATFGGRLVAVAAACFIHALLPFCFATAGSDGVRKLHEELTQRNQSRATN